MVDAEATSAANRSQELEGRKDVMLLAHAIRGKLPCCPRLLWLTLLARGR